MNGRPLRILLVHPGASWSTADVEAGLRYGLKAHGVEVIPYRLDERITIAGKFLHVRWRQLRKTADLPKPNKVDVVYHASVGALEMAMRRDVDVVVIVSAMLFHPDVILMMKRAGLRVAIVFTESPYDHAEELRVARLVDGCWTNERTMLAAFRAVNPHAGYLPHAWHPETHGGAMAVADTVPRHDVVFVGSGFPERIAFFNAIDWTGIDLGLYGSWKGLGLRRRTLAYVKGPTIDNHFTAALYRRAAIGLNLYRSRDSQRRPVRGESLSPRAYELAACGAFHLSDERAEVQEVFGDLVPTFTSPTEAAALIRLWLRDPAGRARIAAALPATVAEASWIHRAGIVLADLTTLVHSVWVA